jgi:hypothetical protein
VNNQILATSHRDSKESGDRKKLNNSEIPTAPATQAPHDELIAALLQSPNLRGWERSYVVATRNTKRRSERQLEKVRAIAARFGLIADQGGAK